ncbi:MAG: acetyl-CoA C-acetyltransferase [Pseudomonadota bacterium]
MPEVWIIDSVRTFRGIGKPGKGALAHLHPQILFSSTLKALQQRNAINTAEVDDVLAGCGEQRGKQSCCIARMAVLDAGWDDNACGVTLDRFCGSALTAVNLGAMGIMSGMQDCVVAGGVESMSYLASSGLVNTFIDGDNMRLRKAVPQPHQGVSADMIATLEGITREDVDKLGLESQVRAAKAIDEGRFNRSTISVHNEDGSVALDHEEYPRPATTMEGLSALEPVFPRIIDTPLDEQGSTFRALVEAVYTGMEIDHVHHAGNSSGVVDGAAALLLASPGYAKAQGWTPRAKIRMSANAGASPTLMLTAPTPAAEACLKRAGMAVSDIDLFEVNEAFAAIPIKFMRDLDIDPEIVNVNGGAIALGHPIGVTGAVILGTLLDELERRDLNIGMATMCTGGGMAPATIIERV